METILLSLVLIVVTLISYIILRSYKANQHWAKLGVPHEKPLLILGNTAKLLLQQKNIGELHQHICEQFPNEPVVGYYDYSKPVLLIKDVDLIEKILIKDFQHFTDHGVEIDEEKNPLDISLFTMNGKRWRAFRNKLSPIFTSGKLRWMFGSMDDCGKNMVNLLDSDGPQELDINEILGRFSMDVIGTCAFGIECNNLAQPDNEFRRMGVKAVKVNFTRFLKFLMLTAFPKAFKKLSISFNEAAVTKYFSNIISDTVEHRKKNNLQRNDFVQMMIQLQEKGFVEIQSKDPADDYLGINNDAYKTETFEITENIMAGQAFTFLISGFEATAVIMTYALYELARHPEIMKKVKDEIKQHAKPDNTLTYDCVKEMTYLEQCLKEILRKYPPAPMLFRVCTKEYVLPNGLVIPVGQSVLIAIRYVHYDQQYFPDPDEFRPERFDPENELPSCAFIPFGNGPRVCIAMRFVLMEIMYGLARLLLHYDFKVSPKTREPLRCDTKNFSTAPRYPIYLIVSKDTKEN